MKIQVLFFGSLTDSSLVAEQTMDLVPDTNELKQVLIQQYPGLKMAKFFIAVNQQMVQENTLLKNGDIVALMPPFSGG
ncbi:MAG: molybdopterin synthase sulfur carrier subunit [Chitinophagaceae bacterium]|nr:MAG: molybdopterin synthase sulfur carrier [Chitinophagaceae bacterium]TXT31686.1 MAG: molybdopterin synthase sulfur carrier subunit [Chitinophagaceae bacterium]